MQLSVRHAEQPLSLTRLQWEQGQTMWEALVHHSCLERTLHSSRVWRLEHETSRLHSPHSTSGMSPKDQWIPSSLDQLLLLNCACNSRHVAVILMVIFTWVIFFVVCCSVSCPSVAINILVLSLFIFFYFYFYFYLFVFIYLFFFPPFFSSQDENCRGPIRLTLATFMARTNIMNLTLLYKQT